MSETPEIRDALQEAITYALGRSALRPRGSHDPDDGLRVRQAAARTVVDHLMLCGWQFTKQPPPPQHVTQFGPPCDHFGTRPRLLRQLRGHLEVLRVACPVCFRQGVYSLEKQIEKHGAECSILDWMFSLTETCPVRAATPEQCAAGMIDMEQVLKRLR